MSISQARANLAEVVDQVRVERRPIYLARRNRPVAVLIDLAGFEALAQAQATLARLASGTTSQVETRLADRLARLAAMEQGAAPFAQWVKPGTVHPPSASDLYAQREVGL